jgi:hypothetical protein
VDDSINTKAEISLTVTLARHQLYCTLRILVDQMSVHKSFSYQKGESNFNPRCKSNQVLTQVGMQQADPMQPVPPTHNRFLNGAGVVLTDTIAVKAVTMVRRENHMFGVGNDTKVMYNLSGRILNNFGMVG